MRRRCFFLCTDAFFGPYTGAQGRRFSQAVTRYGNACKKR
ncbi:hypothetical protein HMPREF0889_1303 [Megasphaera lornae]|uniref:Uncharacterized protein n=1 Tax=Megasphaera lornae TaxID=1000568 RepID=D3LWF8_9FIRM|nr:hypothetical protein HMPREF0889_1303 [Megasphaera genomosp. type_1 str. 28L]